jgi:ubiquitin carboxyl-terminal hydrolase 4/11/15
MGLTGLTNLGNTCFMNSALQCLSNTNELSQYFLSNIYANELNTDNVLGTGGRLANSYAKLINELWFDNQSSISPWNIKKIIGKFQPMVLFP